MELNPKMSLEDFEERLFKIYEHLSVEDRVRSNLVTCINPECGANYPKKISKKLTGGYCVACYKEIILKITPPLVPVYELEEPTFHITHMLEE